MQTEIVFSPSQRSCNLCFAFEHKHHPLVGVDGDVVDGACQSFSSKTTGRVSNSPSSNIMPPMAKRSKRAQREHYAAKRGSWNGLSPVTRVVQSKKTYDRNRVKRETRRANDI